MQKNDISKDLHKWIKERENAFLSLPLKNIKVIFYILLLSYFIILQNLNYGKIEEIIKYWKKNKTF